MHPVNYGAALSMKLTPQQRMNIEKIADIQHWTLGESTRYVLNEGFKVLNMKV
jgi:hypothetical protein